jgi:hypothetical protein
MDRMLVFPRSRGALSGVLLVLLGAWGGLIAFVGPYLHYAYTPATAWTYTHGRLWLEILPGLGAMLGGLITVISRFRPVAMLGAWLAAVSGAWFAVGGVLIPLWARTGGPVAGTPVGGTVARIAEQLGFFTGLGVVIVFLAAVALGRFSVVGAREARAAARPRAGAPKAKARAKAEPSVESDVPTQPDVPTQTDDPGQPEESTEAPAKASAGG